MEHVLQAYGLNNNDYAISQFGSGLINRTWVVTGNNKQYILQRINDAIFKSPQFIANNIDLVSSFLSDNFKDYFFPSPEKTVEGQSMVKTADGYFRLFAFVPDSHSIDVVVTPPQAYEAAAQFGHFTALLGGLDVNQLKITLPDFHNLKLRYEQFLQALDHGNKERIAESGDLIAFLKQQNHIAEVYEQILDNPDFKLRVTHHDTKISNVLFNPNDEGLCVIDLDTIMPGYFISDVGDMMRTYLSPVSEEEADVSKIEIRDAFYHAIVSGYRKYMDTELTDVEKKHFFYAGCFMIYMQALRFLTDYMNNDVYYGAKYAKHNLVRAKNQTTLLQRLLEKKAILENAV